MTDKQPAWGSSLAYTGPDAQLTPTQMLEQQKALNGGQFLTPETVGQKDAGEFFKSAARLTYEGPFAALDVGTRAVNTAIGGTLMNVQALGGAIPPWMNPVGTGLNILKRFGGETPTYQYASPLYRDGFQLSDIFDTYQKTWGEDKVQIGSDGKPVKDAAGNTVFYHSGVTAGQAISAVVGSSFINVANSVVPDASKRIDEWVNQSAMEALKDPYNTRHLYAWNWGLNSEFNVFDETERDSAFGQGLGRWITGTSDAVIQFYAGPDVLAAKAVGYAGRTLFVQSIDTFQDLNKMRTGLESYKAFTAGKEAGEFADNAARTPIGRLAESFVDMDEIKIAKHKIATNSSDPTLVARVLGRAKSYDEVSDGLLAMSGDVEAAARIFARDPIAGDALRAGREELDRAQKAFDFWGDRALKLEDDAVDPLSNTFVQEALNLSSQRVDELQSVYNRALQENSALQAAMGALNKEAGRANSVLLNKINVSKLEYGPNSVERMANQAQTALDRSTGAFIWKSESFKSGGKFGRTITVWRSGMDYMKTNRINGYVRLDDPADVLAEVEASMNTLPMLRNLAKQGPDALLPGTDMTASAFREQTIRNIVGAKTATERLNYFEAFEKQLGDSLAAHYGLDAGIAQRQIAKYQKFREGLQDQIKQRGWFEDSSDIHVTPELQSLLAQRHATMDLKFIEDTFRMQYGSGIRDKWAAKRGIKDNWFVRGYDAVWRPLVLMRLGYTFRNVTEGNLRELAAFGTLGSVMKRSARSSNMDPMDSLMFRWGSSMASPVTATARRMRYGSLKTARDNVAAEQRIIGGINNELDAINATRTADEARAARLAAEVEDSVRKQIAAEEADQLGQRASTVWTSLEDEQLGRLTELSDDWHEVLIAPEFVKPMSVGGKRSNVISGFDKPSDIEAQRGAAIARIDPRGEKGSTLWPTGEDFSSNLGPIGKRDYDAIIAKGDANLTEEDADRFNKLRDLAMRNAVNRANRNGDVVVRIIKPGHYEVVRDPRTISRADLDAMNVGVVPKDKLGNIEYVRSNVSGKIMDARVPRVDLTEPANINILDNDDELAQYKDEILDMHRAIFGDDAKPTGFDQQDYEEAASDLSAVYAAARNDPQFAEALSYKLWVDEMKKTQDGMDFEYWLRSNGHVISRSEVKRITAKYDDARDKSWTKLHEYNDWRQSFREWAQDDENLIAASMKDGQPQILSDKDLVFNAGVRANNDKLFPKVQVTESGVGNLAGPGFYTTESPVLPDGGYIAGKAIDDAIESNGEPVMYLSTLPKGGRDSFLDVDELIDNPDSEEWIGQVLDNVWNRLTGESEFPSDLFDEGLSTFRQNTDGVELDIRTFMFGANNAWLIKKGHIFDGTFQGEIADRLPAEKEFWKAWTDEIKHQGYHGIRHLGGGYAGQGELYHDVFIWYKMPKVTRVDGISDRQLEAMRIRAELNQLNTGAAELRTAASGVKQFGSKTASIARGASKMSDRHMSNLTAYMESRGIGGIHIDDPLTQSGYRTLVNPSMVSFGREAMDSALPGSLLRKDYMDRQGPKILAELAADNTNVWKPYSVERQQLARELGDNQEAIDFITGVSGKASPAAKAAVVRYMQLNDFSHIQIGGRGSTKLLSASELMGARGVSGEYMALYPDDIVKARVNEALSAHSVYQEVTRRVKEADEAMYVKQSDLIQASMKAMSATEQLGKRIGVGKTKNVQTTSVAGSGMEDFTTASGRAVETPGPLSQANQGAYNAELAGAGGRVSQDLYGYAGYKMHNMSRSIQATRFTPGDQHYFEVLAEQINHFYRNDLIAVALMQNKSKDEILHELFNTERGRSWVRQADELAPFRGFIDSKRLSDDARVIFDEKIDAMADNINKLIPDAGVRELAAGRDVTPDYLRTSMGWRSDLTDFQDYDFIHNNANGWRKFTGQVMHHLGTIPENQLVRHPFFRMRWREEMQRQLDLYEAQGVTEFGQAELNAMSRVARNFALKQTNETLYTIQRVSTPAQMFKFIIPFYPAWASSMRFWMLKMPVEKPESVARYAMAWNAPESAGWVYDDDGNKVQGSDNFFGKVTDKFIGNNNANIVIEAFPGWRETLGEWATLKVSKGSLDVMLQGDYPWVPGLYPLITVASGALAAIFPDIATNMANGKLTGTPFDKILGQTEVSNALYQAFVPFGAPNDSKNLTDLVLSMGPKHLRLAATALMGETFGTGALTQTAQEIHRTNMTDYELAMKEWYAGGQVGEKPVKPNYLDAVGSARTFTAFQALFAAVTPVQGTFQSKYKVYTDAWRNIQEQVKAENGGVFDYQLAKSRFLGLYGPEFFRYTKSISGSSSGMSATVGEYKEANAEPELMSYLAQLGANDDASFITMATAPYAKAESEGQSYDPAVRAWQMDRQIPGAPGKYFRGGPTSGLVEADVARERGWDAFTALNQQLDAVVASRGLDDIQQDQNLVNYKRNAVQAIGQQFPDWAVAYQQSSGGKYVSAMQGIEGLLKVGTWFERHKDEPYAIAVKTFYDLRGAYVAELQKRASMGGGSTISAKSNSDLLGKWAKSLQQLYIYSPDFANMHRRFFGTDNLLPVPSKIG